jgi:hypothetical protein
MVVFSLSSLFLRGKRQQLNDAQKRHDIVVTAAMPVVESVNLEYSCSNCLQQFKIDRSNEVKTKARGVGKTYPAPSPSTSGWMRVSAMLMTRCVCGERERDGGMGRQVGVKEASGVSKLSSR